MRSELVSQRNGDSSWDGLRISCIVCVAFAVVMGFFVARACAISATILQVTLTFVDVSVDVARVCCLVMCGPQDVIRVSVWGGGI